MRENYGYREQESDEPVKGHGKLRKLRKRHSTEQFSAVLSLEESAYKNDPIFRTRIDGNEYRVKIPESDHQKYGEKSNQIRASLVDKLEQGRQLEPVMIKLITEEASREVDFKGVIVKYDDSPRVVEMPTMQNNSSLFSKFVSSNIFFGEVEKITSKVIREGRIRRMVNSYWVNAKNPGTKRIKGIVKPTDEELSRPEWEYNSVSPQLIFANSQISKNMIFGNKDSFIMGLKEGDNVLLRLLGNNAHLDKKIITHFFEPVVTIRDSDDVFNDSDEKVYTGVYDDWDEFKRGRYRKRDTIRYLPIVSKTLDRNQDTVGLAYVPTPEDSPSNHVLTKVFVHGAENMRGQIIEEAEIVKVGTGSIIANIK